MLSSRALLLVDALELLLAFPGEDAAFGRSSSDEISTLAALAGFEASLSTGMEVVWRGVRRCSMGHGVDSVAVLSSDSSPTMRFQPVGDLRLV